MKKIFKKQTNENLTPCTINPYKHQFHLVANSQLPILMSMSSMLVVLSIVFYWHPSESGTVIALDFMIMHISFIICTFTMLSWFIMVVRESQAGQQTYGIQRGLRLGIVIFIASKVMFFFAYFHHSLSPFLAISCVWPPMCIQPLNPWGLPLTNTLLLLSSGVTITFAHRSIVCVQTSYEHLAFIKHLFSTIILWVTFLVCQSIEYKYGITFSWKENVYGSIFFILIGFHGFYVTFGTLFFWFCFVRAVISHEGLLLQPVINFILRLQNFINVKNKLSALHEILKKNEFAQKIHKTMALDKKLLNTFFCVSKIVFKTYKQCVLNTVTITSEANVQATNINEITTATATSSDSLVVTALLALATGAVIAITQVPNNIRPGTQPTTAPLFDPQHQREEDPNVNQDLQPQQEIISSSLQTQNQIACDMLSIERTQRYQQWFSDLQTCADAVALRQTMRTSGFSLPYIPRTDPNLIFQDPSGAVLGGIYTMLYLSLFSACFFKFRQEVFTGNTANGEYFYLWRRLFDRFENDNKWIVAQKVYSKTIADLSFRPDVGTTMFDPYLMDVMARVKALKGPIPYDSPAAIVQLTRLGDSPIKVMQNLLIDYFNAISLGINWHFKDFGLVLLTNSEFFEKLYFYSEKTFCPWA